MSALRRSVPVRRVAAASVAQRDTWVRNFQSTPRAEADSMGNLIDKGKEGAEYVVSGTILFLIFTVLFSSFPNPFVVLLLAHGRPSRHGIICIPFLSMLTNFSIALFFILFVDRIKLMFFFFFLFKKQTTSSFVTLCQAWMTL